MGRPVSTVIRAKVGIHECRLPMARFRGDDGANWVGDTGSPRPMDTRLRGDDGARP